jgi:hypothetical protein
MTTILEEFAMYPYPGDGYNELRVIEFRREHLQQYRIGPLSVLLDVFGMVQDLPAARVRETSFHLSIARHRKQDGAFPFSHRGEFEALGNIVLFGDDALSIEGGRQNTAYVEISSRAFIEFRRVIRSTAVPSIALRTYFPPRKPEPGITVGAVLGITVQVQGRSVFSLRIEDGECKIAD